MLRFSTAYGTLLVDSAATKKTKGSVVVFRRPVTTLTTEQLMSRTMPARSLAEQKANLIWRNWLPKISFVVEAAVLLDTNWDDLLDGIGVVNVSEPVAVKRVQEDRDLTA